jgi:hypothetical protein
VAVPAGDYFIVGTTTVANGDATTTPVTCNLLVGLTPVQTTGTLTLAAQNAPGDAETVALHATVNVPSANNLTIQCEQLSTGNFNQRDTAITAIRVGAIH